MPGFQLPPPRLPSARSDRPLHIEMVFDVLDTCESLADVDTVLRVVAGHGYTPVEIVELRADCAQRIGSLIVQEILSEAGAL